MNFRRAVQCGAVTCLMTLAVPSIARADNGVSNHSQTTTCRSRSDDNSTANQLESDTNALPQQESFNGHDSRDTRHGFGHNSTWWYWFWYWYWHWHRNHCVPDPPADVPEAPQVLMLSGSAFLTGGAAMLIIRRRARNSAPAGT
jgi:hypothetical protein